MALEQTLIGGGSMVVGKSRPKLVQDVPTAPVVAPAPATKPAKSKRAVGVPDSPGVERMHRDEALARTGYRNKDLVEAARSIAHEIARERGSVTSSDVFAEMHKRAPGQLRDADPRFMGVVFRGPEWEPLDWSGKGSHGRPARRWKLRA